MMKILPPSSALRLGADGAMVRFDYSRAV